METFSALLAMCAGNSPVTGEFPAQRPVTRSFDIFIDMRLNERLRKQSWGWWFETPSRPLWRHIMTEHYSATGHYEQWDYHSHKPNKGVEALCNIRYSSETHLKLESHKNLIVHKIVFLCHIVLKFCTEHGSIIAVLRAKVYMIGYPQNKLWANETSRDLSLRCVSDGYSILHKAPEYG